MNRKIINYILYFLFFTYFSFILVFQIENFCTQKSEIIATLKKRGIYVFFEQNWSMFSPNPPNSNRSLIVKFVTTDIESSYLNINDQIRKNSAYSVFSFDQRILKYFTECFNNILKVECNNSAMKGNKIQSHGLESILNYSALVLKKQAQFNSKLKTGDSIYIKIYLKENQKYMELNHFFLRVNEK